MLVLDSATYGVSATEMSWPVRFKNTDLCSNIEQGAGFCEVVVPVVDA